MSLKELRLQKNWSQEELSLQTNLSTRTIQRIEKTNTASNESIKALANAFNLGIEDFKNKLETNQTQEETNTKTFLLKDRSIKKFILVNIFLFLINIFTSPSHLWFIYPLLGWGIPLFYKKYNQVKI